MGISVRPARAEDIDGLLAFDMTVVVRSAEDWARAIGQCDLGLRQLLVAVVDGVVAGFGQAHYLEPHSDGGPAGPVRSDGSTAANARGVGAAARRWPPDPSATGYYLTGVTVLPDFRRQGLALQLTVPRLEWIRDRADAVWCFINAHNDASIRLHEKLGFVEIRRAPAIHGVAFAGSEGVLLKCHLDDAEDLV